MKTAIITGPTGAIGSALCRKLLNEGFNVYAVCRPGTKRVSSLPCGTEIVYCDLSALSELPEKIEKADVFYHFGWADTIGEGRNDMTSQIGNLRYTIDAVRAAAKLGCDAFIGAGSQAEYGRLQGDLRPDTPCFPENGYGMAKLCAGMMSRVECEKFSIRHIWGRVLSVYGPNDGDATMVMSTLNKLAAGERPQFTAGEQQWDYLYADDAANAFYLMAQKGLDRAVYVIGGGKTRALREYIETIRDTVSPGAEIGLGEIPYQENQVMYLCADITDLTRDTGFTPAVEFEEGMRRTAEWYERKGE